MDRMSTVIGKPQVEDIGGGGETDRIECRKERNQFSRHLAPHVVHYQETVHQHSHTYATGSREEHTLRNVVIGSSALRICNWKKYARSPLQFSAGHCAVHRVSLP